MTIPAQAAIVSFAAQPGRVGSGAFTPGSYTWYKFRSPRVSTGTIQDVRPFPLETGGPLNPSAMFKAGRFFAGTIDVLPRAQSIMGWLLMATMGLSSSVTGTPVSGMSQHIFRQDPANTFYVPWLAVRIQIPGQTSPANFGEIGYDCKVTSVRITIPAAGKPAMRFTIMGRKADYLTNPSWTYSNANFEAPASVPDAGRGEIKLGGVEYPFVAMEATWINNLSTPQQEMIIGEFEPDDFVPLAGRSFMSRLIYKYEHSQLYQNLLTNSPTGTAWSSLAYGLDTGAYHAFEAQFQSPGVAVGSTPYNLRMRANSINLAQDGPLEAAAGAMMAQSLILTAVDPVNSALDYFQFVLENANNVGYVWPT